MGKQNENEPVAPINHGFLSATATTGAQVGKKGIGGMAKGALALPVAGAAVGGLGTGLLGLLAVGIFGPGAIAFGIAITLVGALAGGVLGTAGIFTPLGAGAVGLGGILGAFHGLNKGGQKVERERAAAAMVKAQIDMARAQQPVQHNHVYAPSNGQTNVGVTDEDMALMNARMRGGQGPQGGHLAAQMARRDAAQAAVPTSKDAGYAAMAEAQRANADLAAASKA